MDKKGLDIRQLTSSTCMHGEVQQLKYVKVENIHALASFEQLNRHDNLRFLENRIRWIFILFKNYIIHYTFPAAPKYQDSVLDNRFHVCVVISYHYRTTGEMSQTVTIRYIFGQFTQHSLDAEHVKKVFIKEDTQIFDILSTIFLSLFKF